MSNNQEMTSSGRVIKRPGMNNDKKNALQQLREARAGTKKRTD